jgi:hypothetical protein
MCIYQTVVMSVQYMINLFLISLTTKTINANNYQSRLNVEGEFRRRPKDASEYSEVLYLLGGICPTF